MHGARAQQGPSEQDNEDAGTSPHLNQRDAERQQQPHEADDVDFRGITQFGRENAVM